MLKNLEELAAKIHEHQKEISEITKEILKKKMLVLEIENAISENKVLINKKVVFDMPELKNEAQRSIQINLETLANADIRNLNEKQNEIKKDIIELEYKKDIKKAMTEYLLRMYELQKLSTSNT